MSYDVSGVHYGKNESSGPVDPEYLLGLALKSGALDALSGDVKRARIDTAVSAQATPLGELLT